MTAVIDNPTDSQVDRWLRKQPLHAAIMAAVLMLSGCSGPVTVENPFTGEGVVCREGGVSDWNPWSQHDACVADHVTHGWTVSRAP